MEIILQGEYGMKKPSGDFYSMPTEASRRKDRGEISCGVVTSAADENKFT
jgi:hypothetical protein